MLPGIGLECARELVKHGARVLLLCRNVPKANEVAAELGAKAEVIRCELSSLQSVRECAQEVHKRCPRIDVLLNNAGIGGKVEKQNVAPHRRYSLQSLKCGVVSRVVDGLRKTYTWDKTSHFSDYMT